MRKATLALAADSQWAEVFAHRFGGDGALAGHAVGNLALAGLLEVLGDPAVALDFANSNVGVGFWSQLQLQLQRWSWICRVVVVPTPTLRLGA